MLSSAQQVGNALGVAIIGIVFYDAAGSAKAGGPSRLPCWSGYRPDGASVGHVDDVRLTAWVAGRVQGVGFRWWTRHEADALGLSGWATNLPDGRVEVVAEGSREACQALIDWLESDSTPGYVRTVTHEWSSANGLSGFRVR